MENDSSRETSSSQYTGESEAGRALDVDQNSRVFSRRVTSGNASSSDRLLIISPVASRGLLRLLFKSVIPVMETKHRVALLSEGIGRIETPGSQYERPAVKRDCMQQSDLVQSSAYLVNPPVRAVLHIEWLLYSTKSRGFVDATSRGVDALRERGVDMHRSRDIVSCRPKFYRQYQFVDDLGTVFTHNMPP